jgi:hypothetical protein
VDGSLALGVVAIICALGVPLPVTVRLLALSALKLPTS